jgi:hypothetical protein
MALHGNARATIAVATTQPRRLNCQLLIIDTPSSPGSTRKS